MCACYESATLNFDRYFSRWKGYVKPPEPRLGRLFERPSPLAFSALEVPPGRSKRRETILPLTNKRQSSCVELIQ
jgi:hypothetical protein